MLPISRGNIWIRWNFWRKFSSVTSLWKVNWVFFPYWLGGGPLVCSRFVCLSVHQWSVCHIYFSFHDFSLSCFTTFQWKFACSLSMNSYISSLKWISFDKFFSTYVSLKSRARRGCIVKTLRMPFMIVHTSNFSFPFVYMHMSFKGLCL